MADAAFGQSYEQKPLRRLVFILNPQSDRGRTAAKAAAIRAALGGRFELELRETTRRGEAVELAFDAGASGCDAVVAIGGDGTVHEVANGLMRLPADVRPPLGIVPAGSGNDVAFALGLPNDWRATVELIERNATRRIDVGLVTAGQGRSRYCVNNVGWLLEGVINRTSHQLSWPRGSGLYLRAMLQTFAHRLPAATLRMAIDGVEHVRTATLLSVGNGPRSGGRFQLLPGASLDDGRFDYLLAAPTSRLRLLWNVRHALAGRPIEGPWIERGRFARLGIASDAALVAHIDGEPWLAPEDEVREAAIEVLPRALEVVGEC